jgi:hypothetical protein
MGRRRRWWWLVAIGVPVALVLVLYYAPVVRYRPSCGGWAVRHYFNGPMRDVFVDQMTEGMRRDKFPYVRIGNELFIQLFDPDDFIINADWKIANSIGFGYGPGDTRITPPLVLSALMDEAKAIIEQDPSMSEEEKKWETSGMFHGDCELIRAAAIRIEDMKPEELLRYVPKSPLPPKCTPYNMRSWGRRCGRVVRGNETAR